jgi:hypothetical protein
MSILMDFALCRFLIKKGEDYGIAKIAQLEKKRKNLNTLYRKKPKNFIDLPKLIQLID